MRQATAALPKARGMLGPTFRVAVDRLSEDWSAQAVRAVQGYKVQGAHHGRIRRPLLNGRSRSGCDVYEADAYALRVDRHGAAGTADPGAKRCWCIPRID